MRLIDADKIECLSLEGVTAYGAKLEIDAQPTINPNELQIVKELRKKLDRYEKAEQEGRSMVIPDKSHDLNYDEEAWEKDILPCSDCDFQSICRYFNSVKRIDYPKDIFNVNITCKIKSKYKMLNVGAECYDLVCYED